MAQKLYEIRRYIVIVPYQAQVIDGFATLSRFLVNAAVLVFWLFGAALFTTIRLGVQCMSPIERRKESPTTIYFSSLAGVLGNSMGGKESKWKGEYLLMFIIGVFATITSMMFTGALFEQLLFVEQLDQIDSLQGVVQSNLTLLVCLGDTNDLNP